MGRMKTVKRFIADCGIRLMGRTRWLSVLVKVGNISKNAYYNALTEAVMSRVLKPNAVCVDVGCNRGLVLEQMMRLAPNGRFLAFEPVPDLYNSLKKQFACSDVLLFSLALSDRAGVSSFNYVTSNPSYSGLKKRQYDRPDETDCQIEVQTQTLDAVLASHSIRHVDFIKIDVEGAEYLVLKGAVDCLQRDKPVVVFEHGKGAAECYQTRPEEVYAFLTDVCGLRVFLLNDWLLNKRPLSGGQFCRQFHTGQNYYFLACP